MFLFVFPSLKKKFGLICSDLGVIMIKFETFKSFIIRNKALLFLIKLSKTGVLSVLKSFQ